MVQFSLAIRASLHTDVLVQVLDSDTHTSPASLIQAVKEVFSASRLADTTLITMELLFTRIEVIQAANFTEVLPELDLAFDAELLRLLDEGTLVAFNFFDVLWVEFVRARCTSLLLSFRRRPIILVLLVVLRRPILPHELLLLCHLLVMTEATRVENLADLALQSALSVIVEAGQLGCLPGESFHILLLEVSLVIVVTLVKRHVHATLAVG